MDYKIESLDTNLIITLLTVRDEALYEKLKSYIRKTKNLFYIDDIVISEAAYVLKSRYGLNHSEIAEAVEAIIDNTRFITNRDLFKNILPVYLAHPKLSFNDCYIAEKARQKKALPLWTSDHKFALQSDATKEFK